MLLGINYWTWLLMGLALIATIKIVMKAFWYDKYLRVEEDVFHLFAIPVALSGFFVMILIIVLQCILKEESWPFWRCYRVWIGCLIVGSICLLLARRKLTKLTEDHPDKANDSLKGDE